MGVNSKEFLLMRAHEESGQLYVPSLPKKEIQAKAQQDAQNVIDGGDAYLDEVLVDAVRISEYLTVFIRALRDNIKSEGVRTELKGVEISFKSAPTRLNYKEDTTWCELMEAVKQREELLKVAEKSKDAIYDSDGAEVPRVSRSGGGEVINLKY
jgi:hypothetical protein